jgi:hypothetical protein
VFNFLKDTVEIVMADVEEMNAVFCRYNGCGDSVLVFGVEDERQKLFNVRHGDIPSVVS